MRENPFNRSATDNMQQNMYMKMAAKALLSETRYQAFMKSYRFTFWSQLIGTAAGFLLPCAMFYMLSKDLSFCLFGAACGIVWMCIWLPLCLFLPQAHVYRKFAKWFRKGDASVDELDAIFDR